MPTKHTLLAQASRLGSLTLLSSALGFCREVLIARQFGATHVTDSYLVALSVPMLAYALLFGAGLNVSLVPRLTAVLGTDPAMGRRTFAQFVGAAALASLVLTALIFILPQGFLHIFAPGIAKSSLSSGFVRSLAPVLFLLVVSYSFGSFHCASQKVSQLGLVAVTQNGALVVALLLFSRLWGSAALVGGTLAGAFLALILQTLVAHRDGFREPWMCAFEIGAGQKILFQMVPFALALGVGGDYGTAQADVFLMRFFGSGLETGSITLLSLGNKIMALPVLLIGASLGVALLSSLSDSLARRDERQAAQVFGRALCSALLLACPIAILYLDLGPRIISLVFRHTSLATDQLGILGSILRNYSGAVIGLVLAYVFNAYLAALRRTRALIGAGVATVCVDALLMWALKGSYRSAGIALAISIGSFFYSILLLGLLARDVNATVRAQLAKPCALISAGAVAMHIVLQSTVRLNVFAATPWLSKIVCPAIAGVLLYVVWLALNRSRLRLELRTT
jgi:putative peptidoglycan lipid II flippase